MPPGLCRVIVSQNSEPCSFFCCCYKGTVDVIFLTMMHLQYNKATMAQSQFDAYLLQVWILTDIWSGFLVEVFTGVQ